MSTPTQELYSSLEFAYEHFNRYLFGGKLPPVVFTAREAQRRTSIGLGYYFHNRWVNPDGERKDEIAINFRAVGNTSIITFMQTLVHEMCHAQQQHFGTPSRRAYHNREFAAIMERVGLITSDTGRPGGARVGQKMSDYPLPGGPFAYACIKLMFEKDFKLAWVDVNQLRRRQEDLPDVTTMLTTPEDFEPYRFDLDSTLDTVDLSVFSISSEEKQIEVSTFDDLDAQKRQFLEGLENNKALAEAAERAYQTPSGERSWLDVLGDEPEDEKEQETRAKKTKACYICPTCHSKVWGKQGLLIKCMSGGCDKLMEAAE